jgi:hypothetical protein
MPMFRSRAVLGYCLVGCCLAAASFVASAVRAAECPLIFINQTGQQLLAAPDLNSPPPQTQLPDSLQQYGYVPAAMIHVVGIASGLPTTLDTKGWCTDLAADAIADQVDVTHDTVISKAKGSVGDGSLAISEQSSVSGGGAVAQGSALVQIGFRDVLHVQASGSDLVPITLHRHVSGTWTLDGGDGGTLDKFIYRRFVLTIWERTQTTYPPIWTRRLVIDDRDLDLLNGDESYAFEALPGKDLILSIYADAMGGCGGDQTYGDPPALYSACYGFMDFGDEFGEPITFDFEPGPGVALTSDAGFTQYVPEPGEEEDEQAAYAVLFALGAVSVRRRV